MAERTYYEVLDLPRNARLQRIEAQAPSLPLWQAAATRTIGTDGSRQEVESAVARALDEALARHR